MEERKRKRRRSSKDIYTEIENDEEHEVFGISKIPASVKVIAILEIVVPYILLFYGAINFSSIAALLTHTPIIFLLILIDIIIIFYLGVIVGNSEIIISKLGVGQIQYGNRILALEWKHIERICIRWDQDDISRIWFTRGSRDVRTDNGRFGRNLSLMDLKRFIPDFDAWPISGTRLTYHHNPHFQ